MCTILLVRHGEHPLTGRTLVGRDSANVHLSELGQEQARDLAELLADRGVKCIQSSPRVRCLETAAPLADHLGLPVHVHDALDEVDFGDWTGLDFAALESDPKWYAWNVSRARARAPGGETIAEARTRVLRHIERMSVRYPSEIIAMFTHAEIIRAIRLHFAELSPDDWRSVDVPLASVTELEIPPAAVPQCLFEAAAS